MSRLFLELLNVSIMATWIILIVLILRLVLKKAPNWINCVLWAIVAIRLVLPFNIESTLSLIPSAKTVPVEIGVMEVPMVNSGIRVMDDAFNPVIIEHYSPTFEAGANSLQIAINVVSIIWGVGMVVLLLYALVSFCRLKRKVSISKKIDKKIFVCDEIDSPFILGIFRPYIYIPSGIDTNSINFVLCHEKAHLKRGDHFWKPLGYLILALYWFNPFCWVAYICLCKDIELACDEKAIKDMDKTTRATYCQVLLSCSVNRRMIAACPIAFGEVGVKERIKSVLNYRKPASLVIVISIITCIVVSTCFLTIPKRDGNIALQQTENNEKTVAKSTISKSEPLTIQSSAGLIPESDEDYYSIWSDRSKQEVEEFAKLVRTTILKKDWEELSGYCLYPVNVAGKSIATPVEFIETMGNIDVGEAFISAIEQETCEDMFSNWHGCMFGHGEVWINSRVSESNESELDMGIITLNL